MPHYHPSVRSMKREVYGRTGTSNDSTDALSIGVDDRPETGVWVGRNDNPSIGRTATGGNAALPIWMDFMSVCERSGRWPAVLRGNAH
jgi:penicillin-binding protein 1A